MRRWSSGYALESKICWSPVLHTVDDFGLPTRVRGLAVMILAFQAGDPSSNLGERIGFLNILSSNVFYIILILVSR
jgi:hypothetical protein